MLNFVTHEKGEMEIIRLQYAALSINKLKTIPLFQREQQKNDRKTSNLIAFPIHIHVITLII